MSLALKTAGHSFLRGEAEWILGLNAIIGPSGAGKTTLLRLLAGLGEKTADIRFKNAAWQGRDHYLPPHLRPIAFVPQYPSLIPFRRIRQQIEWVLSPSSRSYLEEWAEELEILPLLDRYPRMLSGGEQQRAAILRALATGQPMLLLDEALSQVEDRLRQHCLQCLKHNPPVPWVFYSTHRLEEALEFSDTLTVITEGQIHSPQTPQDLLMAPPNAHVAWMLGYRGSFPLDSQRFVLIHPARVVLGAHPEQGLVYPARIDVRSKPRSLLSQWTVSGHNTTWHWDLPQYVKEWQGNAITIIDPVIVSYALNREEAQSYAQHVSW